MEELPFRFTNRERRQTRATELINIDAKFKATIHKAKNYNENLNRFRAKLHEIATQK